LWFPQWDFESERGVERLFVKLSMERFTATAAGKVSNGDLARQSDRSEKALRCTLFKNLLGEDHCCDVRKTGCGKL